MMEDNKLSYNDDVFVMNYYITPKDFNFVALDNNEI